MSDISSRHPNMKKCQIKFVYISWSSFPRWSLFNIYLVNVTGLRTHQQVSSVDSSHTYRTKYSEKILFFRFGFRSQCCNIFLHFKTCLQKNVGHNVCNGWDIWTGPPACLSPFSIIPWIRSDKSPNLRSDVLLLLMSRN